jgi:hypothetical protein
VVATSPPLKMKIQATGGTSSERSFGII